MRVAGALPSSVSSLMWPPHAGCDVYHGYAIFLLHVFAHNQAIFRLAHDPRNPVTLECTKAVDVDAVHRHLPQHPALNLPAPPLRRSICPTCGLPHRGWWREPVFVKPLGVHLASATHTMNTPARFARWDERMNFSDVALSGLMGAHTTANRRSSPRLGSPRMYAPPIVHDGRIPIS